jgi:hypothetical protein
VGLDSSDIGRAYAIRPYELVIGFYINCTLLKGVVVMGYKNLGNVEGGLGFTLLDGGMNANDLPFNIKDNQAFELDNLWYENKILSGRPGLIEQIANNYGRILHKSEYVLLERLIVNNILQYEYYGFYIVTPSSIVRIKFVNGAASYEEIYNVHSAIPSKPELVSVNFVSSQLYTSSANTPDNSNVLTYQKLYVFSNNGLMEIDFAVLSGVWHTTFKDTVFKTPVLNINRNADGTGGQKVEGLNKLCGKFIERFATNGVTSTYYLSQKNLEDKDILITFTDIYGCQYVWDFLNISVRNIQSNHTCNISGFEVYANIDKDNGIASFIVAGTEDGFGLPQTDGTGNILEVSAITRDISPTDIFNCSISRWYGGDNQGASNGIRLFLSGNQDMPNTVFFSDVNDPTYFPVENYIKVGSPASGVTALSCQSRYLIIYKTDSIHSLNFALNKTNIFFPQTQINSTIGCNAPESIQYINNHLTWLHNDILYFFVTNSTTNEHNIREISRNMGPLLKNHTDDQLKNASSAIFNGNYMLFVDDKVYLWDYETTSYINKSDNDAAQKQLAWYQWSLPIGVCYPFAFQNKLYCFGRNTNNLLKFTEDRFDQIDASAQKLPINVHLKSKIFCFDQPETYKRIVDLFLHFPKTCTADINVSFISEDGSTLNEAEIISPLENTDEYGLEYRLRPNLKKVRFFGFTLSAGAIDQYFSIIGFSLHYVLLGEVK